MDASFDYSGYRYSGLGGLIVNMSDERLSFFSTEVDKKLLDNIMAKGQKTVIQELEMMAVLAALRVWRKLIRSCRVVLFTDGEAVRRAFLKSWSANEDRDKMSNIRTKSKRSSISQFGSRGFYSRAILRREGQSRPVGNVGLAN